MTPAMTESDSIPANSVRLTVAGLDVVVAPTQKELRGPIADLFRLFHDTLGNLPSQRRALVGLAGVPGSGKSTLAALLEYLGMRQALPLPTAAVSIDGWHWPNATLDAMTTVGPDGQSVSMRTRKGSPGSFDVGGIVDAIGLLRDAYMPARLPVYDRRRHEAVPAAHVVAPGVRLIVLEGNYVLCRDEPWRLVAEQLDLAVYVEADPAVCREAVIGRHIIGGLSRQEAIRKYETNDALNAEVVAASKRFADVIIHTDADRRLTGVEVLRRRASGAARSCRLPAVGYGDPPG